ncbi:hypothetical protein [Virgibacillus sp. SK37]|uniref:hypothetical protein n=1 Tax=Virgibacillus sp. SK37 TaxID=403957 RepID=UPI0004D10FB0|nr:hypothetical protein [Virgibacillus sp. SK37]AIF45661.1 hypothetical protein X953_18910 [Virgibacillus sp. SK37]
MKAETFTKKHFDMVKAESRLMNFTIELIEEYNLSDYDIVKLLHKVQYSYIVDLENEVDKSGNN